MIRKSLAILLSAALVLLSPGIESYRAWAGPSLGKAGGSAFGPGGWNPAAIGGLFKSLNPKIYAGLQIQGIEIEKTISYFKDLDFELPPNQNAALPILESLGSQRVENLEDYLEKQSEGKEDVFLKAAGEAVKNIQAEAEALTSAVEKGDFPVRDLPKTAERADLLADQSVYLSSNLEGRVSAAKESLMRLRQMRILSHVQAMAKALERKTFSEFVSGREAGPAAEFSGEKSVSWVVGSRAEQILGEYAPEGENVPEIKITPERLEENAVDAEEIILDARHWLKPETTALLAAVLSGLTEGLKKHQARVLESRSRVRESPRADVSRRAAGPEGLRAALKPAGLLWLALGPAVLLVSLKFPMLGQLAVLGVLSLVFNEFLVLRHVKEKIETREVGLHPEKFDKPPEPDELSMPLWLTRPLMISLFGSGFISLLSARVVDHYHAGPAFVLWTLAAFFVLPVFISYFLRLRLFFSMGFKEEILEKAWEIWDETRYYMDSDPGLGPSTRHSKVEDWRNVLIFIFLRDLPDSKGMEKSWVEMILRSLKSSLQDYEDYVESDGRLSAREKRSRIDAARKLQQKVRSYSDMASQ